LNLYTRTLCHELETNDIRYENQISVPILYKGNKLGDHRLDLLVEGLVIVELKAAERIEPVFRAQLLSYMKLTEKKVGLLINFNVPVLKDGVTRVIL